VEVNLGDSGKHQGNCNLLSVSQSGGKYSIESKDGETTTTTESEIDDLKKLGK
jgi:hypothetical protein